ncbi:uncharacterized protein LOC118944110 isoform X2 [Oncorhynchus mykiss]|uniref:uncharacterized protein LOC118944110 isoform X2 n=1 Tax=Oncorhynchus mykiss TaxID=8022 RepID=UPI00187835B3|nr:uncharacterized protein LOC118944110 isoform X2 [Oncorhynchus mykiss]
MSIHTHTHYKHVFTRVLIGHTTSVRVLPCSFSIYLSDTVHWGSKCVISEYRSAGCNCIVLPVLLLVSRRFSSQKTLPRGYALECHRGRHRTECGSNGRLYKSLYAFQIAQYITTQLQMAPQAHCAGTSCQTAAWRSPTAVTLTGATETDLYQGALGPEERVPAESGESQAVWNTQPSQGVRCPPVRHHVPSPIQLGPLPGG